MTGPWREPPEETEGLYPGLTVCDNRVSGSITLGRSRLPVWCFIAEWPEWDAYGDDEPGAPHYGVSRDDLAEFVGHLFEMRGEFARLLLVLANAERGEDDYGAAWWQDMAARQRVVAQLRRCLAALEESAAREVAAITTGEERHG